MQDIALKNNISKYCDLYPKVDHIRFDGNHLSTLITLYDTLHMEYHYKNHTSDDDAEYKDNWIVLQLREKQLANFNGGYCEVPTLYYFPDPNVVICCNHKAGSVSLNKLTFRYEEQTNKEVLNVCSPLTLLNLIESRDPEIWYIYRDPLVRFMSYFYYNGPQNFHSNGVRWEWQNISMYDGMDTHRIPQFVYIPGYLKAQYPSSDFMDDPRGLFLSYNDWAYNNIENFIPHKNVKFFWLHEKEVKNRENLFLLLYRRLGIRLPLEPSDTPQDNLSVIAENQNNTRPDLKKIDVRFIQKIWDSQIPERNFLSKLRWENGPIQFHGLT